MTASDRTNVRCVKCGEEILGPIAVWNNGLAYHPGCAGRTQDPTMLTEERIRQIIREELKLAMLNLMDDGK